MKVADLLATKLVLKAAAFSTTSAYSAAFDFRGTNALELATTLIVLTGSGASLALILELSDDSENWAGLFDLGGLGAVGYTAASIGSVSSRRGRIRFDLVADSDPATAILSAEVREARL